jgi:hypothetical protein
VPLRGFVTCRGVYACSQVFVEVSAPPVLRRATFPVVARLERGRGPADSTDFGLEVGCDLTHRLPSVSAS